MYTAIKPLCRTPSIQKAGKTHNNRGVSGMRGGWKQKKKKNELKKITNDPFFPLPLGVIRVGKSKRENNKRNRSQWRCNVATMPITIRRTDMYAYLLVRLLQITMLSTRHSWIFFSSILVKFTSRYSNARRAAAATEFVAQVKTRLLK